MVLKLPSGIFGYSFEHINYTIFPFTAQVPNCANFVRFAAFYVPLSSLGKNLSKISKLSREVYPQRIEESASIASFLFL